MEYVELEVDKFDWDFVGLDFGNWEEEKLWALDIPTTKLNIEELLWHFDCPFWENDNGERYTITPRDVLNKKAETKTQQEDVAKADTKYPIDIYFNKDKWLILDGIHRLVKLHREGITEIDVRVVTDEQLPKILSGEPIEMPDR